MVIWLSARRPRDRSPRRGLLPITDLPPSTAPVPKETVTTACQDLQGQAASVEAPRPQLRAKLLDRAFRIRREEVLDDPDLGIVVERQVDVLGREEVDGDPLADRAADSDADRAGPASRREQEEGGGKDGSRLLLGEAEEAPGPLACGDAAGREVG